MKIIKNSIPHLLVVVLFLCITFTYFPSLIEGKMLEMPDIKNWQGASKEVIDFRDSTGEQSLWTNSMFSGMPTYQIYAKSQANLVQYIAKFLTLGLPNPANRLFLYLIGFYILLLSLKVDYRLSAVGAIAFSFSSYFFIIIEAGHTSKAHAIAYIPMVVASVLYTYRGKMFLGGVLTALTVALEIYANHLQITYYLILMLFFIGLVQFIKDIRSDNLADFFKRTIILVFAALLAAGTAFTNLATTLEYSKVSTRGQSELTSNIDNKTSGLDKDYATSWSYGIAETFTLLIPNFYGGASQGSLSTDSETYQAIKSIPNAKKIIKQLPLYWGDQPFTSGPTYAGTVVIFLFILGLFFVKSEIRIWIVLTTIMSILLAWGKNFMSLTEFFLDFFPGYNKFRAVSMILILAEFTIPLLAFVALDKFLKSNKLNFEKLKALKYSFYIAGSITLLFTLFPTLFFDFIGNQDANLAKNGWPIAALQSDRVILLSNDALRSFIFIVLTFFTLLFYIKKILNSYYVILILGFLILVDMWPINKRYLSDDNFSSKRKVNVPYKPTAADQMILKDTDLNFRVFNQSVSTFNDASTSYFHKSIGGYHGAKLKRYQELIENHISKGNMSVLNMLNTRYFISNIGQVQQNYNAVGNAWFVNSVRFVSNADEEIMSLNDFNPKYVAIVDTIYNDQIISDLNNDSSSIILTQYKPNYLKYISKSSNDGIAIFSEIYYEKGWVAYIDGNLSPHFRANFVLRGMQIPSGTHIIEFKFEPSSYYLGENIAMASSFILLLLLVFVSIKELRR